jgi:hypothetical protein
VISFFKEQLFLQLQLTPHGGKKSMLNCYFGFSVYLTEKMTTVVTSISRVWLRTLFIPWGHQSLFRENISRIDHIIISYTSKETTFSDISFSKAVTMQ